VSNDKLFYILNSYMSHCGGSGWGVLMKKRDVNDSRYLAISTTWKRVSFSTYIVFVTKLQKRQIPEKGSALFKNDITDFERTVKMLDT